MIANGQVVSIHYTLTNGGGEKLDSSDGQDPLNYLHGHGNIVPGLENALTGKSVGDKFDVVVTPAEGYGERDEAQVGKLPRAQVGIEDVKPGMRLQADTPEGPMSLLVTEVSDDELTVDANHPLAGETLHFAIEVMEVRAAEASEIDHGHVH